jgi:hypothetical protein
LGVGAVVAFDGTVTQGDLTAIQVGGVNRATDGLAPAQEGACPCRFDKDWCRPAH